MRKYVRILLVNLVLWMIWNVPAKAEEELLPEKLYAQSAVLMDADSGRILFEKNGNEVRANASTTKILTCILALENGNMEELVTASKKAAGQPKVHLGMREGQSFYLKDLLYSLMLESHNDSAVAIAEHISGSTEEFAKLMNEKAKELGCTDTHFVSPNGLDWEDEGGDHGTTAADLARIMRYCISASPKTEEFLKITQTPSYTFSDSEGNGSYSCVNHNAFLSMMEGALSGKTGFTNKAGYCYVGALRDGERTFIVTLLACGWPNNKSYKWSDARSMLNYGLEHYQYLDVAREISMEPVKVENGVREGQEIGENAYICLKDNGAEELPVLVSDEDEIQICLRTPIYLKAPVEKGARVGELVYLLNGEPICSYPVITMEGAEEKNYIWCLERIVEKYLGQI